MATGQPDTKYDLSQSTNPEKQSPVILKQGCRKALYKQLKKDNPTIAFEDENGTHGKTTR